MPQVKPKVELIQYTHAPEQLIAMAARLCYSSADIGSLKEQVSAKDQQAFVRRLMDMGHESPLEHTSFCFGIEGVSRSFLAQITRHRIASFSVQSQRYVAQGKNGGFDYLIPPAIEALGKEAAERYAGQMVKMNEWYEEWRNLLGEGEKSNEDARFVLPNACATRMIVTMNARELLHFFRLRCCERAQWEIRYVAWQMLKLAYAEAPVVFGTAGPSCVSGPCPEGAKSCGKMAEMRANLRDLKRTN